MDTVMQPINGDKNEIWQLEMYQINYYSIDIDTAV